MLHENATPTDGIHVIHAWEVADAAALVALVPVAADVGKIARQLDTGEFWILEDNVGPAWRLVGIPAAASYAIADAGAYFDVDTIEAALQALGKGWRNTVIPIACSDETTALTAGVAKVTFRMPFAFKLSAVRASLSTAQTSGAILTVDINVSAATILSTKLTIDNTEKTSTTATTPAVISDTDLADDEEITIDIDQVGDGTATGLKIYLIGAAV